MRVLYVASGTKMSGGATKSLIAMLHCMQNRGVELEVVCPDSKGLTQYLKEAGIKVHTVHFRHNRIPPFATKSDKVKWLPRLIHDSWVNFRARAAVTAIARRFDPDLIHENTSVIDVGYYAAKKIGVPDVVHIREYGDLDFKMKLPGRSRRLRSENVFTISITKDIFRHLGQDSNPRAAQIYNGIVDRSDFRYVADKKKYFLYAGRIEPAKGIDELLEAYAQYAAKSPTPYPLYICGGTNYRGYLAEMKKKAEDLKIASLVEWKGEYPDMSEFMSRACATVIPSRFEALGRVMPEAMANGSLCIGRYTGGTAEQIDNGKALTGEDIAFSYNSPQELAGILLEITEKTMAGNPFAEGSDYRRMILNSQRAVKEFFSIDSLAAHLMDFYRKIIAPQKQSTVN